MNQPPSLQQLLLALGRPESGKSSLKVWKSDSWGIYLAGFSGVELPVKL